MSVQCVKAALLLGGMPPDAVALLLPHVSGPRQCHPCSVLLLQRAAWEAREAAREQQWEIAAAKLGAILLMLHHGFVDVYRENFTLGRGGEVHASNATEFARFQRCAAAPL